MICKACGSGDLHKFTGELTASASEVENVRLDPVYVCQPVVICMDCGFTETVVSSQELSQLKNMRAAIRSKASN